MKITGEQLQEKIKNGEKIILKLEAEWCNPCRMMKPIFERVATENTTEVQMYSMDVDDNRDLVISLGVRSVPTVKTFSNGQVIETKVGVLGEGEIKGLINGLING